MQYDDDDEHAKVGTDMLEHGDAIKCQTGQRYPTELTNASWVSFFFSVFLWINVFHTLKCEGFVQGGNSSKQHWEGGNVSSDISKNVS